MNKLFIFFVLLTSIEGYSQGITAPSPLIIEANATNVDAGNFVVTWPNNTDQILVSASIDYHSIATLSFPTTTNLTKNYGYNSWTGVTSIVFFGTRDNINNALAAMTISMGSIKSAVRINIEISQYDATYVYNPVNKHFYKFISGAITYTNAKSGASGQASFRGKTPYLATITSSSENDFINNNVNYNNIWVAMSDASTEGRWVYDAGPEANINFWNSSVSGITNTTYTAYASSGNTVSGFYANWCANEPNNADGSRNGEDAVVAKSGGATCWNDLADGNSASVSGYLVEISSDFPAGSDYTGVYSAYTVHNNELAYTLSSTSTLNTSSISNLSNLSGGLSINDGHTVTVSNNTTIISKKIVLNGSGKMLLNTSTSKWTPENSTTNNTIVYSPSVNTNPQSWASSGNFSGDAFYANAPYISPINGYHFTPWIGSPQGWSSVSLDVNQYITLNYPIPAFIAGIVTQGRQNSAQWVKAADIDVSINGTDWTPVLTNAQLNTDQNTIVTTLFSEPIYAKFVRLKTTRNTDWYGHITLRLGLLIKSYIPNIITDGIRLRLDASESGSYSGSGTTWNDIGNNAYPFTLVNSPTYTVTGYFDFDGINDYAVISHTSALKPTTAITTEQWLSADNWGAGTSGSDFKCSLSCTESGGYSNNIWANNFYSYLWAAGAYRVPSASVSGFTGWHHFVTTFDGRFVRLYVDAQIKSTVDLGAFGYLIAYDSDNSIIIGAEASGTTSPTGSYWDGKIGSTLIYNRALTASEILQNYNNTKSKFGL